MNLAVLFILNSDTYTEFFYLAVFSRNLIVQNRTLCAHETGRIFPLQCRGVWLSPVFGFTYITLQYPARVWPHIWCPLALVSLFHSHNVLVKFFTLFVTDFSEIFWGKNTSVTPGSGFSDSYCVPWFFMKSKVPAQHPDSSLLCDFLRSFCKSS